jgi:hypothetical protein
MAGFTSGVSTVSDCIGPDPYQGATCLENTARERRLAGAKPSLPTAAVQVSKQLDAIANLLEPCYEAEDALFAIREVASKATLDAEDSRRIKTLWAVAGANLKNLNVTDANAITDGAVQDNFLQVINALLSADFITADDEIKALGTSVSLLGQTAINNLFVLLDAATKNGTVLITRISTGLLQNLQQASSTTSTTS